MLSYFVFLGLLSLLNGCGAEDAEYKVSDQYWTKDVSPYALTVKSTIGWVASHLHGRATRNENSKLDTSRLKGFERLVIENVGRHECVDKKTEKCASRKAQSEFVHDHVGRFREWLKLWGAGWKGMINMCFPASKENKEGKLVLDETDFIVLQTKLGKEKIIVGGDSEEADRGRCLSAPIKDLGEDTRLYLQSKNKKVDEFTTGEFYLSQNYLQLTRQEKWLNKPVKIVRKIALAIKKIKSALFDWSTKKRKYWWAQADFELVVVPVDGNKREVIVSFAKVDDESKFNDEGVAVFLPHHRAYFDEKATLKWVTVKRDEIPLEKIDDLFPGSIASLTIEECTEVEPLKMAKNFSQIFSKDGQEVNTEERVNYYRHENYPSLAYFTRVTYIHAAQSKGCMLMTSH